jgi:hypothetical protein
MTASDEALPTKRIACAIIEQAWVDIVKPHDVDNGVKAREFRAARLAAIGFFEGGWFEQICLSVGLDPEPIRSRVRREVKGAAK